MVSKVDLDDLGTGPMDDSEAAKEEDFNVASMGIASIVANTDTRQTLVDPNE